MRVDRDRLMILAMRALEDALAQVEHGPVERTWGHRLALAWITAAGIAQEDQAREFWRLMASADAAGCGGSGAYLRTTAMTGCLRAWYRRLGWQEPGAVQRGAWAHTYARAKAS